MDEVREIRHFHFLSGIGGSAKVSFAGRTPKAAPGQFQTVGGVPASAAVARHDCPPIKLRAPAAQTGASSR